MTSNNSGSTELTFGKFKDDITLLDLPTGVPTAPLPVERQFLTAALLSVMSGVTCVEFGKIHELVEYLADQPVWTHQLPRVFKDLKPHLVATYPELWAREEPFLEGLDGDTYPTWLEGFHSRNPEFMVISKVPNTVKSIDPEEELKIMAPHLAVTTIELPSSDLTSTSTSPSTSAS